LQRIATTAQDVVVLVDALDEETRRFYAHYEFIEPPGHDLKLFLPIETVMQLFL